MLHTQIESATFKSIMNNPFLRFTLLILYIPWRFYTSNSQHFLCWWNSITEGLMNKPIFYYSAEWKRSWYVTLYTQKRRTVCMIQNKVIYSFHLAKKRNHLKTLLNNGLYFLSQNKTSIIFCSFNKTLYQSLFFWMYILGLDINL